MLDQPQRHKGRGIGVGQQEFDRVIQIFGSPLASRKVFTQHPLGAAVAVGRPGAGHHRLAPIAPIARRPVGRQPITFPTRQHTRQFFDIVLAVGFNVATPVVALRRAVGVELEHANGEQLQQFTRVVFIRRTGWTFGALGAVLIVVQVMRHVAIDRDLAQQGAVAAKSVAVQQVDPVHMPRRFALGGPGHQKLRQRPHHPQPQLIRRAGGLAAKLGFQIAVDFARHRGVEAVGVHRFRAPHVDRRQGQRQLFVNPLFQALGANVGHQHRCGAKADLIGKTAGGIKADLGAGGGGNHLPGRGRGRCALARTATGGQQQRKNAGKPWTTEQVGDHSVSGCKKPDSV